MRARTRDLNVCDQGFLDSEGHCARAGIGYGVKVLESNGDWEWRVERNGYGMHY